MGCCTEGMRKKIALLALPLLSVLACSSGAGEDVGSSADPISTKPPSVAFVRHGVTADIMSADRLAAVEQGKRAAAWDNVRRTSKRADGTFDIAKNEKLLKEPLVTWLVSELVVEGKIDAAWSKVVLPTKGAHVALDEAVLLALTETHVLLRRSLDKPKMHTVVPGLDRVAGCRGDLLADELVPAYASAITGLTNALGPHEAEPLRKLATQIACLGSRQLAELDLALGDAAAAVAARLGARRKSAVVGPYIRALAPLMLLVADAQKHRGARAATLHWFGKNKSVLSQQVKAFGWSATARVFLYDRRSGVLEAFRTCTPGQAQGCVNPAVLLETLTDPRALGTGACGLAAMATGGEKKVPLRGVRYVCPTIDCGAPSTAPDNKGALDAVRSIWPEESKTSDTDLGAPGCLPGAVGGKNMQGGLPESCDGGLAAVAQNPFDEYTACIAAAIPGPAAGGAIDTVQGMPLGSACGLLDGTSDPEAAPKEPPPPPAEKKEQEDKSSFIDDVVDFFKHTWAEITKTAAEIYAHGPHGGVGAAGVGTSVILGTAVTVISPEGAAAVLGAGEAITDKQLKELFADKNFEDFRTLKTYYDLRALPPGDRAAAINALKAKNGGNLNCVDAFTCTDTCTGLGAQITKFTACSDGLVRSVLQAAGRPMNGKPGPQRDLSRVSNPRPDGEVKSDGADGCFIGALNPADNSSPNCGLVSCADGLSTPSSTACCGGRVTAPMLTRTDCLKAMCPLSTVDTTTGACGCGDVGSGGDITPIPPPPPNPEQG